MSTEFSITEEAFDPSLNPIRAKVSLGLRVLSVDDLGFSHKGGSLFLTYQQQKERLAAMASGGTPVAARHRRCAVNDPLRALFRPQDLHAFLYPPNSRYHGLPVRVADIGRRRVAYLSRRFVPAPEDLELLREYAVKQGDRIDGIAAEIIGDPEQYWRIADMNRALDPAVLSSDIGRILGVPKV